MRRRTGSQHHAPGWASSMNSPGGAQHLVYDAEVVDGLVATPTGHAGAELPDSTVARSRTHRPDRPRVFWRYPTIRLNQINWYALMYAAVATVTGRHALLARPRAQLPRFCAARRRRQLRPGMRFHYLPHGLSRAA